jgi:transposase
MADRGLYLIFWPANSPDLNPIEDLWEKIKDYIEEHYPKIYRLYKKLREAVVEAWNTIKHEDILSLIRSMLERCKAVIAAKDGI